MGIHGEPADFQGGRPLYTQNNRKSSTAPIPPIEDGNPSPNLSFFSELASLLSGQPST